jgi:NADPH2:quinone reductase
MKAAVLVRKGGASAAFEFRELEDPVPGRGEVTIDVELSGLNFADVVARLGLYRDAPPLPLVLGYEVVGRIEAVGPDCGTLTPGMRVVAMTRFGGYATRVLTRSYGVVPLPEEYDGVKGTALATQFTTAWFAAEEMVCLHEGDRVLIHSAAGGLGTALVQIAKRHGCMVFGSTGTPEKLHYLHSIGVDKAICLEGTNFEEEFHRVAEGKLLDVIFDPLGGSFTRKGLRLLGTGGRMVCLGVSDMVSRKPNFPRFLRSVLSFGFPHPVVLIFQSKGIIGVNMLRIGDDRPEVIRRCLQECVTRGVAGEFQPVVGGVFSAQDVAKAHEALESRRTKGKLALRW